MEFLIAFCYTFKIKCRTLLVLCIGKIVLNLVKLCVIDVYIRATYILNRWSGMVRPITWFNPPKPDLQSRTLYVAVCIINSYSTLLNSPIVSLLILFILFSMLFLLIHDYTMLYWFSLLQFGVLQLHLYMTLLYSFSFYWSMCLVIFQ